MANTTPSVDEFIESIDDESRRDDTRKLVELVSGATNLVPQMWGNDTIGFGRYHYRYESGRDGDFFSLGLSPRKRSITLYIMSGLRGFEDILDRLGPHRSSKSCVYLNRLADVDSDALVDLAR
ncbi:MAG: DUF1801 domain-containing protein, partial [Acidimicrobiia bacterium]|nr:DUF1801 domain-containing protein [Acidimicrobiia bacterium]